MRPRQTGVSIIAASSAGGVTTIELRRDEGKWPEAPTAPASAWSEETAPTSKVVELHRLVRLDGETAVFESYDTSGAPQPGDP